MVSVYFSPAADLLTYDGFGRYEVLSVCSVEVGGTLACELEVLLLVFSDWDLCCSG